MDKASFMVKMDGKSLEREAKRLQKEAQKERNKAKAELKKGNRQTAQLYAQNAVRYDQQATSLLQSCSATQGYATDMRNAQVAANMAKTMSKATAGMQKNANKINLDKLSANRTKMDGLKQKLGAAHDLMTNGEGEIDLNAGAEDLLATLEAENAEDAMIQMADIPTGIPSMAAPVGTGTRLND
ncbi:SNF7 family protein [Tritrichomonas foetus]|uniref:SNF7 family protein n=1 Tax=Tritrichomonas foetus TaxID=1144522 RepID=A0A1J4KBZ0_9EUKA|nr:SNF7 family protein [Tritrichomonas foetus]|eukprot:OHT06981.1 SNF7 family protein [Tritrichomonas foetus]